MTSPDRLVPALDDLFESIFKRNNVHLQILRGNIRELNYLVIKIRELYSLVKFLQLRNYEKCGLKTPGNDDFVLESYKDKSNSIQRITIIFLGVAFFFFFMILIPYYSLKLDNHRILQMDDVLTQARNNISSVNQSLIQQQAKNASIIYNSLFLSKELPKKYEPYKSIRNQYLDTISNLSKYPSQINVTRLNAMLQRITYKECTGRVGSPSWISCNLNHREKYLKEKISLRDLTAFAPLNNTITARLNNAINLQYKLIDDSKNFHLNSSNFVLVKNALNKLNDPMNLSVPLNNTKYLVMILFTR